jgi:hypothetical protein
MKATKSSWVRRSVQRASTRPECTSNAAVSACVPCRWTEHEGGMMQPKAGAFVAAMLAGMAVFELLE